MKAYQIKIELKDSSPSIWRRVIIPADVTFKRLHDTIQFAMDWQDYHLYEFDIPQEQLRITNDEEAYEQFKYYSTKFKSKELPKAKDKREFISRVLERTIRKPQSVKIDKYLETYKELEYVYDFGDYWRHRVTFENVLEDYPYGYPQIIDGEGACPPEDVGGIGGYANFLEAWSDAQHPDHEAMRSWGEVQRYREFNIHEKNDLFKCCLKLKKTTRGQ
ncbi:plasmid pRiA4b ORF-3 family protein [Heliobacterium gestii]|uniref:Plasmid pRiA4b ORF-3 family protein n=1 Tax=Heliomicrobium gestii TaxID=2699 RepID=A0A845L6C2_HELGE|nr:plasmid pRiA4b ORF-3 family protein [Heliomicrobium gestii]MBM7866741.1 hypothetical protein [Heliomicrobium gestii]MZP42172.1 plasmid pRiA4b ORF-3 family protein [Heliomicrobium gestii]